MIEPVISQSPWSPAAKVATAVRGDERERVPAARPGECMRTLALDTIHGPRVNVQRMRTLGFISRHHHPAPVHGLVVKGSRRYLEPDWVATDGSYVFEAAGLGAGYVERFVR